MLTEMDKRKYTLKRRAESQEETRARIVEATMALHEELGPRNTTISAVAERAGVQRLTVYRHFPDETALFQACTSGWLERNPPPPVPELPSPQHGAHALETLYAYFRGTERMWVASYRDVDHVPALQDPMQAVADYLGAYAEALTAVWPERNRTVTLRAAATLSVQFATWRTLAASGLPDSTSASAMLTWLRTTARLPEATTPSEASRGRGARDRRRPGPTDELVADQPK